MFRWLGAGASDSSTLEFEGSGKDDALCCANPITASAGALWDNSRIMETSSLDLLYLDTDPRTGQRSACIYVKSGRRQDYAGVSAEALITSPCLSFIELDAEIRRLHAELEEIRARAKRKFYKAEATAAGA